MNKSAGFLVFLMIAAVFASGAHAVSVGTAPGVYDLGELKPGKDYAFSFYLTTNSQTDVLVALSYIPVHADIYDKNATGRYTFIPSESSQEEINSWVEIPKSNLLLSPGNVKIVNMEGGGVVKSYGTANIILHVPGDAEPGYHAGAVTLSPNIPSSGGGGTGVVTFGVTRFIFVFRVAGIAVRKGDIMTLIGYRLGEDRAKVTVLFKNTGTDTIEAWVSTLKLYDKFGNLTGELRGLNREYVRPNQIISLDADWSGSEVKPGTYRAQAVVDYLTGSASFEDRVDIPATVTVEKKAAPIEAGSFPWLTILLILIVLILAYYYLRG